MKLLLRIGTLSKASVHESEAKYKCPTKERCLFAGPHAGRCRMAQFMPTFCLIYLIRKL